MAFENKTKNWNCLILVHLPHFWIVRAAASRIGQGRTDRGDGDLTLSPFKTAKRGYRPAHFGNDTWKAL